MRILQIRFKNLNSLVGEWTIDLTHPAYTSDGIFAITGPTGAGKTTILDAICLALYGRTPRLHKVTKSGNEIMSRQSGECFAEVTFEVQRGRSRATQYRCHWSQHRARKKPGGDLQPPKHEVADAHSGEILEAKIRKVAGQIEAVTGMDFDRFTRSMLLAQGGFAAFLQAAPDERAPILEQITGTEIYSQISVRAHERHSFEQKKLDALQAELAGMQLLSAEDEQQLDSSLERRTQQEGELNQQIIHKNQAITWLDGITRLKEELQQLGLQKDDLQIRLDKFAPQQARLKLANQALELSGDYSALTSIRREQNRDRDTLAECQKSLPNRKEAAKLAEGLMKAAAEKLETKRLDQKKALLVIRQVRELDLKIAEKDLPIKTATESIEELTRSTKVTCAKQKDDCAELNVNRKIFESLLRQLEVSSADKDLVEQLAGIRGRFEALQSLHGQQIAKFEEINQADSQLQKEHRVLQEQSENRDKEKRGMDSIKGALTEKQAALQKILEHEELADWRNNHLLLTAQKGVLSKALDSAHALLRSKQTLAELGNRKTTLNTEESTLTSQLKSQTEKQAVLEKEVELLETQLILLKKIEELTEARQQLLDGTPCPLCGAKEHPFAEGNVPVPDEARQRLTAARSDLRSVSNVVSKLNVKLAQVGKDLEGVASGQKEHSEKIEEADRLIVDLYSELRPDLKLAAPVPNLDENLRGLQEDNQRSLEHVVSTIRAAEAAEKALNTLSESLGRARESLAKAERETQAAAHKRDSARQRLERLQKEAANLQGQQEKSLARLQLDVQAFGVETLSIEQLDLVYEQLSSRRDQWLARQNERAELDQKIAALEIQTRHQNEQIQNSENEFEKQQGQLDSFLQGRKAFVGERQDVFGAKNPDVEEARFSTAVDSADRELDIARKKLSAATLEFGQLKFRIEALEKAIETRNMQLKLSEEAFRVELKRSGFSGEQNYRSASVPENERKALAGQSQKLSNETIELTSREREKTRLLGVEQNKQLTEETQDEIKSVLAALVITQRALQQEIGGIQQKLKDNQYLKQQQQGRIQAIDAQKSECSRWGLLHELIGSADGKKYRNFAQGLTFEMMIGHANRQLQKMTDRYLMIRDDAQPLELNVIDNYQAGEIRSTKNLSGGESFIVSLALALGLSQMASKNVRVDSLFLDEGFGTLDEDALDTALEALSGLQQDGKLIGVISHVSALKERISTQIQVLPKTGGRSIISGPGCVSLLTVYQPDAEYQAG